MFKCFFVRIQMYVFFKTSHNRILGLKMIDLQINCVIIAQEIKVDLFRS